MIAIFGNVAPFKSPCETAGFTRLHAFVQKNPSCHTRQVISLWPNHRWCRPISIRWGSAGSSGRGESLGKCLFPKTSSQMVPFCATNHLGHQLTFHIYYWAKKRKECVKCVWKEEIHQWYVYIYTVYGVCIYIWCVYMGCLSFSPWKARKHESMSVCRPVQAALGDGGLGDMNGLLGPGKQPASDCFITGPFIDLISLSGWTEAVDKST